MRRKLYHNAHNVNGLSSERLQKTVKMPLVQLTDKLVDVLASTQQQVPAARAA